MAAYRFIILAVCLGAVRAEGDSEITRVQTLKENERSFSQGALDDTKTVYSINILPLPRPVEKLEGQDSNDLNKGGLGGTPPGKVPALLFLQKVNDDGRLPDGIYYRPAPGEKGTPPPVIQKEISDLQAFALVPGVHRARRPSFE